MSKPVLCLDVDSTIHSAEDAYDTAAIEVFGKPFYNGTTKDWYDSEYLTERFGEEYWRIFESALCPTKIPQRRLYEGCQESILELKEDWEITFLTNNHRPNRMHQPLKRWLTGLFGEVNLRVTSKYKVPLMKEIGAFGLIDDAPNNILGALEEDYFVGCILQPWNEEIVNDSPEVHGYKNWKDLKDHLQLISRKEVVK